MPHLVTGSAYRHSGSFDGHCRNRKTMSAHLATANSVVDTEWLKIASRAMNISSNMSDFVLNDVGIIIADLPNRKMQAFPLEELLRYDPVMLGNQIYMSFKGKPVFLEHDNEDPLQAKGIILDTRMIHIPAYNVWKVHCLCGWDKTKDNAVATAILNNELHTFSMGCWVDEFYCSVCGALDTFDELEIDGVIIPRCEHMRHLGEVFDGHLAYQNSSGCCFFELSAVSQPADATAVGILL